ncbi:MAG: hypothetical protein JXR94_17300 [Candidatus Hydrogenedentes bacterium]|nr:hypothetical protein [Candidatus Hydrogenedentota bacterium]
MVLLTSAGIVCVLVPALTCGAAAAAPSSEVNVPMRAITQGPKAHWFGYYDKHEFDVTGRYVLGMELEFEGRAPTADDTIRLGMVDLEDGDKWIEFGVTHAWCWQQGCMLQWLPGADTKVIYNDRQDGRFVSVIQDVFTGEKRVLPKPVYSVSPKGDVAVGTNFARINETRPGYGYEGVADPYQADIHPAEDGLYVMDLATGESRTLFSYQQIAEFSPAKDTGGKHWFNHLLFNTDGARFIFLHRWKRDATAEAWHTRMMTAAPDGSGLKCVADHEMVSHFIWRNPEQILAWSREPEPGDRFVLYDDRTGDKEIIGDGVLTHDGHCTYSPDGEWVLTDGYPDKNRLQPLMLFRPSDGKLIELGRFYLPPENKGQLRCDLHPRWDRAGERITIDSMHEGNQRQIYLLEVGEVMRAAK